jgi:hypothetical protein
VRYTLWTVRDRFCEAGHGKYLIQEGTMRSKRKLPRKRARGRTAGRAKKGPASKPADSRLGRQLQDLREQIDLVLPEVTARVAALEHLLLEKQLCTRADLIDARTFVRLQEA